MLGKCGGRNELSLFLVFRLGSLHFYQVFTLIVENFGSNAQIVAEKLRPPTRA